MVGGEIPWWRDDRIPLRRWHLSQHIGSVQEQEYILNRSGLPHDLASKQLERLLICATHRHDNWLIGGEVVPWWRVGWWRNSLHSERFVNLNVVSLQNDSPLVSNKHLFSILESSRTFPQDYGLLWQADFNCDVRKRAPEESALDRYSIFELFKYGLISSKFQAFRTRVSPYYQIWIILIFFVNHTIKIVWFTKKASSEQMLR